MTRDGRPLTPLREPTSEKIDGWKHLAESGEASEACDRTVRTRPVPNRLLVALLDAEDRPAWQYRLVNERKHTGRGRAR